MTLRLQDGNFVEEEHMKEDLDAQRGKFYPNATLEEKVAKVVQCAGEAHEEMITEAQAREFVEGAESHGYEIRVYDHAFRLKKVKDFFETEAEEDAYIQNLIDRCFTVERPSGMKPVAGYGM